ncbi:HipA domain-containing protein [Cellulomonas composti]|uniref:Putative kinase Y4mE n=1 Tax=Cellulomonas composti TaxID=266130 RepID=A0A511J948_9CELL|nr:HipA domain-containing protein [Cellulomonas composti]GEL94508.1 putative kinase Y4mE [Cellulomonas composti]
MPERRLEVHMDGDHAGTLTMSSSGALTFGYDDDYRFAPGATPLSLSMPKSTGRHRQRAVLPFVQGLLPDNPQALGSLASSYQVSARSPFALLEHVGHDVAGALQFVVPGETSEDAAADRSAVDTISDDEVAAALAEVIEVYRTGRPLRGGERLRISLAGAQPKIALVLTPDGWARPRRGAPTTHILKPEYRTPRSLTDERFPNLVTVEMFSLAVARHAGLRVPNAFHWQAPDGDLRALVLERYDRFVGEDGLVHRAHQEDLCQAMSVPPEKKYQHHDGGPGVGSVAELLRSRLTARDRVRVARDFLSLLTLNIAMVNTDAHAKNYSLLLRGDGVELAPAYDVLSIAPYETQETAQHPLDFPMRVGDTYRISAILPGVIAAEGVRLGLGADESRAVVDRVLAAVPGALEAAREEVAGVPGGMQVADSTIRNLRAISPLHAPAPSAVDLAARGRARDVTPP